MGPFLISLCNPRNFCEPQNTVRQICLQDLFAYFLPFTESRFFFLHNIILITVSSPPTPLSSSPPPLSSWLTHFLSLRIQTWPPGFKTGTLRSGSFKISPFLVGAFISHSRVSCSCQEFQRIIKMHMDVYLRVGYELLPPILTLLWYKNPLPAILPAGTLMVRKGLNHSCNCHSWNDCYTV